ncbi:uncharacterized protein LOC110041927 isoform X2 [Orbicella faveolata]|uniref:uncharacterized protein LOC110041927 isoform X2 n=1 Tax=Orbicella faveolata TaxID=48498 RepID=UPI0009E32F08|nr:uncharacterized protein LOC110041927 isoform X2 [Orbicella faveolata]
MVDAQQQIPSPERDNLKSICFDTNCPCNRHHEPIIIKCEKCRQESMGEITSSRELLHNGTTNDFASSVVNLLKGAGLLGNLAEIAEKKRAQDEHVLTDKLEMVKGI